MKMKKRLLALVLLFVIVVIYIIAPYLYYGSALVLNKDYAYRSHLSPFGNDYDDLSTFYEDLKYMGSLDTNGDENPDYTVKTIVSSPTVLMGGLVDPKTTIYLCVGVERPYTRSEILAIEDFVRRGGHAIIADDYTYANALASRFGVTFYGGQFYDENFDKNSSFPIIEAHLPSDRYNKNWIEGADGVMDDDQDGDGVIDEDPLDGIDNDQDNYVLTTDVQDNDNDGYVDETNEGIDEDPLDDDDDGLINEEILNGLDDDEDGLIDEDLESFQLISYRPTGLYVLQNAWVYAQSSERGFVDMNGDGKLSLAESTEEMVDKPAYPSDRIKLIVEVPVADDGSGAVDVKTGECVYTNPDFEKPKGQVKKYPLQELPNLGSIVFISDPSIFINDLYTMNHITFDVTYPEDPTGDGKDNDGDGLIDEDREIASEVGGEGTISKADEEDPNTIVDNTPDYWTIDRPDLYGRKMGDPLYDYDNWRFLLTLIYHMVPPIEGETVTVLIDESKHFVSSPPLKTVYGTLGRTAFITSDPYLAGSLIGFLTMLFVAITYALREKESWIHRFNITELHQRRNLPRDARVQTMRLRLALQEKIRLVKGLSTEEFASLNKSVILSAIRDPELQELLREENKVYSPEDMERLMEKIKKIQPL
ncbi:MAG: hypothetical protein J7K08_02075 [Thermoplasmata archaeon]|nr:hypothetical protein [Thermoplasmata archaeon]RLF56392.1 MAG: hypothetical protein DRN28_00530 [Thermoplasmata archaeon]HDD60376.1 hypothetical protein [Euryarchaeota archaeon]